MSDIKVTRTDGAILVDSGYWKVRHDLRHGGCWDSVTFRHGSGRNLIEAPAGSRIRVLEPHPTSDNSSPFFYEERNDPSPFVNVESGPEGPVVVVEGTYQLAAAPPSGSDVPQALPIRFRRRYEYRDWGLVACELEIIADQDRNDVVEVCALDLLLREGMTDVLFRDNPISSSVSDLCVMGHWHRIEPDWRPVSARYVPMHLCCFEQGSEGIEFLPASNLSAWDKAFTAEPGLGYFLVGPDWSDPRRTLISVCPYCVAYRRNPTRVAGRTTVRYYLGLPFVKPAETVHGRSFHVGTGSDWVSDAELERLAKAGVEIVRFHNDYREDGPFWHDGQYPPYNPAGMAELRRIIDTCHRLGMKIVPYISCKEFHPEAEDFPANAAAWRREAGPEFRELHTWYGSGEFGQLMCLESGWLEFRKQSIERILSDLPWDGLYFDWCTSHACRHGDHIAGADYHHDQDTLLDLMFWCRRRVGPEGVILTHLSGLPQIVIVNMSTATLIYEEQAGIAHPPNPLEFPAQVRFMPIALQHMCPWGAPGSDDNRLCAMNCMLAGAPPILTAPIREKDLSKDLMAEIELLAGENLGTYSFLSAWDAPASTGADGVYAAVWHRPGRMLVYLANLTPRRVRGAVRVDPNLAGWKSGRAALAGQATPRGAKAKKLELTAGALKTKGAPYSLAPWQSMVLRLSAP
jgi:hypothetical protein